MIVSQGYDGASVMSGSCSDVQQRIKMIASNATYVHCYAHCLNLALVDCVRQVQDASEFFALMELLYEFMSSTKAHTLYFKKQAELLSRPFNCNSFLIQDGPVGILQLMPFAAHMILL